MGKEQILFYWLLYWTSKFLLVYKNAPYVATSCADPEMMFGKKSRMLLDALYSTLEEKEVSAKTVWSQEESEKILSWRFCVG